MTGTDVCNGQFRIEFLYRIENLLIGGAGFSTGSLLVRRFFLTDFQTPSAALLFRQRQSDL